MSYASFTYGEQHDELNCFDKESDALEDRRIDTAVFIRRQRISQDDRVETPVTDYHLLGRSIPEMTLGQQPQVSSGDADAQLLTLNDAVTLALQQNRLVKNSVLEAQKYDFR